MLGKYKIALLTMHTDPSTIWPAFCTARSRTALARGALSRRALIVEELRKKEINGPIRLPKRDFFTRGQKLKVKDPCTFSPATIWNSPACRHVSVCA